MQPESVPMSTFTNLPKRQSGGIFLHSDSHPHNTTEPAESRCHACGRKSAPGERWYVCDTCEDCRFAQGART
jgi:hypothetical protein